MAYAIDERNMGYTKTIYRRFLQAHDEPTGAQKYLKVIDKKAANTAGGGSSATTWNIRELTDIIDNVGVGATLATNQITLPIGTYRCAIRSAFDGAVG